MYVEFAVIALVVSELAVDLLPLHAPEAEQVVALAVDQESNEVPPDVTVVGVAVSVTVGAGVVPGMTVTATEDCPVVFAAPVHVNVNVLFAVNAPLVTLPLVARAPDHAPDAVHAVASVELHVNVTEPPLEIEVEFTERLTVGEGWAGDVGGVAAVVGVSPPLPHAARSAHATSTEASSSVDFCRVFIKTRSWRWRNGFVAILAPTMHEDDVSARLQSQPRHWISDVMVNVSTSAPLIVSQL